MNVTLFHNPNCSKSRKVLELLIERGAQVSVVEYLKTPPDRSTLVELLDRLGMRVRDIMRTGEAAYGELGLDDPGLDDDSLLDAMVAHPILLQRPVIVCGERAVIGRPPELVDTLFD